MVLEILYLWTVHASGSAKETVHFVGFHICMLKNCSDQTRPDHPCEYVMPTSIKKNFEQTLHSLGHPTSVSQF